MAAPVNKQIKSALLSDAISINLHLLTKKLVLYNTFYFMNLCNIKRMDLIVIGIILISSPNLSEEIHEAITCRAQSAHQIILRE